MEQVGEGRSPTSSPLTPLSSIDTSPPSSFKGVEMVDVQMKEEHSRISDSEEEAGEELTQPLRSDIHRDKRVKLASQSEPLPLSPTFLPEEVPLSIPNPSALPQPARIALQAGSEVTVAPVPAHIIKLRASSPPPASPSRLLVPLARTNSITASQEMRTFLQDMDPEELDFCPSSDPAADDFVGKGFTGRLSNSGANTTVEAGSGSGGRQGNFLDQESENRADDSGVFFIDDPDLTTGRKEEPIPLKFASEGALVGEHEVDSDDDGFWNGMNDAEMVSLDGGLASAPARKNTEAGGYISGDDGALSPDWDQQDASFGTFEHPSAAGNFSFASSSFIGGFTTDNPSTSFAGFTSGRGTNVGPSEAALARARKLILNSSPPGPLPSDLAPPPAFDTPTIAPASESNPTILRSVSRKRSENTEPPFMADGGGFSSGRGASLAAPSAEALRRSEASLMDSRDVETQREKDVFESSAAQKPFSLPPIKQGVESDQTSLTPARSLSIAERAPLADMNIPSPHSSPIRRALIDALPVQLQSPSLQSRDPEPQVPAQSTPLKTSFRAPQFSTPVPIASTSRLVSTIKAFKPPLLSNTPRPSTPSTSHAETSTPLKAVPALRRLNIGMTPRVRPSKPHKFLTPFKGGVRPAGLTPGSMASQKVVSYPNSAKGKGKEVASEVPSAYKAVFDLTRLPGRQSLRRSGLRPQTHYYEYLEQFGIPEEILGMDSLSSMSFVFECGRGELEALARLKRDGATLVTAEWVKNHWSLIVWKRACLVRSKPDLMRTYWGWEAALNELKYRYEREINHAQRSCIKRIQEQDSSASSPMILCVAQIRWDDPPDAGTLKAGEEALQVIVGLELTDGWYRVRASIDSCLKSACERGKIVVGAKLAVSGARLEGSRDGTDVLEALTRSSIAITGNSTSLARWDAKLGFFGSPFVATLASLSAAGGVATLLDLVVERIFPMGYVNLTKGGRQDTWGEAEEKTRVDAWERGREKVQAKLVDAVDKGGGEWDVIIDSLHEASQHRGNGAVDPELGSKEDDELLERIECAKNPDSIIRRLSPSQTRACLKLAGQNAEESRHQAMIDLEEELAESFPPRNVRGFRVIRVKDFNKGKATSCRTAQLTIWDAGDLGSNFLQEGARYHLSNVVPKGNWSLISSEISLSTRRDSRWKKIE